MSEESEGKGKLRTSKASSTAASSTLATGTVFKSSTSVGNQEWTFEYGQWEIDYETAAHRREQEKKDNELRRFCLTILVILLVVVLVVSGAVGVLNEEPNTRQWAQNIVTTLIGGLLGAIAGYFTAKGGS
ncbi:MAG: hypothetical protein ACRDJC_03830 [Thermomicrobiales bacterium]